MTIWRRNVCNHLPTHTRNTHTHMRHTHTLMPAPTFSHTGSWQKVIGITNSMRKQDKLSTICHRTHVPAMSGPCSFLCATMCVCVYLLHVSKRMPIPIPTAMHTHTSSSNTHPFSATHWPGLGCLLILKYIYPTQHRHLNALTAGRLARAGNLFKKL